MEDGCDGDTIWALFQASKLKPEIMPKYISITVIFFVISNPESVHFDFAKTILSNISWHMAQTRSNENDFKV